MASSGRRAMSQNGSEPTLPEGEDANAEAAWRDVMGEAVSRKTRFLRVRDGVLTVELDSGPMKEEFLMARTRIQALMNEHLGREAIRQVVIR